MSDFMKFLYASYIKPQIDAAPKGEYEQSFSLLQDELDNGLRAGCEQALEFAAVHAFLLGLRTGQGLPSFPNG